jgi:hypothetical protein
MKRVVLLFLIFSLGFVFAISSSDVADGNLGEKVEKIENIGENLPVDDEGIDIEKIQNYKFLDKTRAEKRIAELNGYVGDYTKIIWGVELTMSWTFVFAVLFWILLIELMIVPLSSVFDWNVWWSLLGSGIIATLAMQGFGADFVAYIDSLILQWYVGAIVIILTCVFMFFYNNFFGGLFKEWEKESEEEQRRQDLDTIHADAKVSRSNLDI